MKECKCHPHIMGLCDYCTELMTKKSLGPPGQPEKVIIGGETYYVCNGATVPREVFETIVNNLKKGT